ncbi:hypothetical protein [Aerobium aerolatum]|uniref:Uncharacterized protein n=1 Tax=Aquamicrobium aerolatum DSM 21857 TaxID=1121003 RepID=A0A1I3NFS8_9HYPH|nr:hypothetical protein [Aquamicrobium aerolatum]SFJ08143.1 hypothetical protein SAMN03080618_02071 [Aquamicrobium aerolatum DSM 21857]
MSTNPSFNHVSDLSKAAIDILNERARQMNEESWTPAHDDQHADFSLSRAAIAYAACAAAGPIDRTIIDAYGAAGLTAFLKALWPIGWSTQWFKPTSRRRDLIKAAALLMAEIERLDRLEPQP